MAVTYDALGYQIVIDKVSATGPLRNYKFAMVDLNYFGLPIYFTDQAEPLILCDIDRDKLTRIRWDLMTTIEDRLDEKRL